MINQAEKELEAIKAVMDILSPFQPPARKRIMGYVSHYLKSPVRAETPPSEDR